MESTENIEVSSEHKLEEPKKSKRGIIIAVLLVLGLLAYFFVPNEASNTSEQSSDLGSAETTITPSKVKIMSFEGKKRIIGKWVITGVISNTSDAPIESIEFETVFSDNAEFVTYDEFVEAGETDHEFMIKVTGHKGEKLNGLKIREVRKAK